MTLMTAVLIDEHVHEKVFNDRIAELLALFVIKKVHYTLRGYYYFNLHISFLFCLLLINLFLFYVLLCS
jgi:hypothetical protein